MSTPFAKNARWFSIPLVSYRAVSARNGRLGWATIAADSMHPSLLPYHPERDVYRLLQVDPRASRDEINAACRRLARTFHPDRNRSPRANDEMGVINAVREMLVDECERAAYDRARSRFLTGWTPGTARAT